MAKIYTDLIRILTVLDADVLIKDQSYFGAEFTDTENLSPGDIHPRLYTRYPRTIGPAYIPGTNIDYIV